MSISRRILSKAEAEAIYARRREQAYRVAEDVFHEIDPTLKLTGFTPDALAQARHWKQIQPLKRKIDWDWDVEYPKFRLRPKRMELAIWHNKKLLCGLSLGKVSRFRVTATIHLLEGHPNLPPPLKGKVGMIVTIFLQAFAMECGCRVMVVDTPHADLIGFYKKLGFRKEVVVDGSIARLTQRVTDELPFLDQLTNLI